MSSEGMPGTLRVAVLGANGQIGTELCLYLKVMGFCEPIAITRSPHSTALLVRAGVECRSGDLANKQIAATLLEDCDLVFDLALPIGKNLRETKRMLSERTSAIFSAVRPSRGFILASTTSVYRFNGSIPFFRAYRSMKLFAERLFRSLGAKHGVPVYVFRLGQVHGELQSCSELLRRDLSRISGPIRVPDQTSNAIFVFSIAEAIRAVLLDGTAPKTYTLISFPAWSFADLVQRYAQQLGVNLTVTVEKVNMRSPIVHGVSSFLNWIKRGQAELVSHYKELLSWLVSTWSEEMDQKLRFGRTRKIAAATINAYFESLNYRPFEPLNDPRGVRFPFTSDSRTAMQRPEQCVKELIHRLGYEQHHAYANSLQHGSFV